MTQVEPPAMAGELGLTPRQARDLIVPPLSSRDLVSTEDPETGSEFGGVGGLIAPAPHKPTSRERLSMIYAIDPMDDGSRPGSVAPPELTGDF